MVVRCGAVPLLVQLLYSKDVHVCEQALWALANISGDGPECRDFVVSSGIIDPLLSFVNPGTPVGLPPLSLLSPLSLFALAFLPTPLFFSLPSLFSPSRLPTSLPSHFSPFSLSLASALYSCFALSLIPSFPFPLCH